ncbi:MAG: phosphoglucosamine mutase [candidate division NC10 bacterium]|nr:phosphoglucosamine mutase [candidate division NC10 bacterium]
MDRLFGTDGVRGIANQEPMTPETVVKLGRAVAHLFKAPGDRRSIVIGKDTRLTGYMLETALTAGITSMGVDALLVGPLPTPGIAFITRSLRADAGVVISASHNPFEDNGIKFFSGDGLKLPDAMEARIEELIVSGAIDRIRPGAHEIGKAYRINDAAGRYIEFAKNTFPKRLTLRGLKIVVDCAHGAAYRVSPTVLRELGAEVAALNVAPDGLNINADCGSLFPEVVQQAVLAEKAHLGFTHDGDGDRLLCVDERGSLMDGDQILALCALDMLAEGRLPARTVVATVMSNIGLEVAMREAGITVARTPVGDRYVLEEMLRGGYALGGEQSGHVIFAEHNTTGDGIVTALQVLAAMLRAGKPLSELAACMRRFPQVLENVRVRRREDLATLPKVQAQIRAAEGALAGGGRVLVRYSGTEPLARVMVEGPDEVTIRHWAGEIVAAIQEALG